ncbi:MAG: membrane protein insertion efficiency factor YidD [bacterium]
MSSRIIKVIKFLIIFFQIAVYALPSDHNISELDFIISSNSLFSETKQKKSDFYKQNIFKPKNLFIGMIRFYQIFISTQDIPVCNFTPSCSQFGIESIQEFGIIRGILMTSDRLQRCNGMSTSRYQIDHVTGKLIDPVKLYSNLR